MPTYGHENDPFLRDKHGKKVFLADGFIDICEAGLRREKSILIYIFGYKF